MNPNVPWDFPTSPIYQWAENQPPFVPAIQVAQEVYPMLPALAAKIANVAGQLAGTTPIRMYCYNTLSAGNWANDAFTQVLKLTADLIVVQRENPDHVINNVLGCFSSALAANNTMLFQSLPPNLKMAVGENYRIYNEMLASTAQAGNGYRAVLPQQRPMQRPPQGQRTSAVQTNTFSNLPSPRVHSPRADLPKNIITKPVTRAPQPLPAANAVETNIVQGENEMDRNKHALVYGGVVFPSAEIGHKENLTRIEEAISKVKDPTVQEIKDLEYFFDISLTGVIHEAVADVMTQHDGENVIVPKLIGLLQPILSTVDLVHVFSKARECYTLADLAKLIVTYVQETAKDDPELRRRHFAWVSQVDRVMTEAINAWLAGTFFSKVSIDSFLYDACDLASYLSSKYDRAGISAFNRFQSNLMTQQSIAGTPDIDFINESGIKDYECIVIPHCLFTTTETAATLNYDITRKMKRVVRESTSRLYQLLSKLILISRAHHAVRSIIITADGHRYEFFESGLGEDVFHILEI